MPISLIEALTTQKISQNTVVELISLTHTANSDLIACVEIYSNLIKGLLINDIDLKNKAINQFKALMIDEEFRYIAETEKGSAYGTLKILIQEYQKGSSLQDVIKLGGDTDSNGAFYGALYYATRDLPTKYIKKIRKTEVLQEYLDRFKHYCPICHVELELHSRYPNYVCGKCRSKATDKDGRLLSFSNIDFSGGFQARYNDTQEIYNSHICYINGIECYANEARFGGIVIEKLEDN